MTKKEEIIMNGNITPSCVIQTIRKRNENNDLWLRMHHWVELYDEELDILEKACKEFESMDTDLQFMKKQIKALSIIKGYFIFQTWTGGSFMRLQDIPKDKLDFLKEVLL